MGWVFRVCIFVIFVVGLNIEFLEKIKIYNFEVICVFHWESFKIRMKEKLIWNILLILFRIRGYGFIIIIF